MNIFPVVFLVSMASTAQLNSRQYLPPLSASTAGGTGSILQSPYQYGQQPQYGFKPSTSITKSVGRLRPSGTPIGTPETTFGTQQQLISQPHVQRDFPQTAGVGPQFHSEVRPQYQSQNRVTQPLVHAQIQSQVYPQIQPQGYHPQTQLNAYPRTRPLQTNSAGYPQTSGAFPQTNPQSQTPDLSKGYAQVGFQVQPQGFTQKLPGVQLLGYPQVRPIIQSQIKPHIQPQIQLQIQPQIKPQIQSQVRPQIGPEVRVQTGYRKAEFGFGTRPSDYVSQNYRPSQFPQQKPTFSGFPSARTQETSFQYPKMRVLGVNRSYLPPGRK